MRWINFPSKAEWAKLAQRPTIDRKDLSERVKQIVEDVRSRGDEAVLHYTRLYDYPRAQSLKPCPEDYLNANQKVSTPLKEAIEVAIHNIEKFHRSQWMREPVVETMEGVQCWRKRVPIEKVGLYIPGGTAPLFSSLLMLAIPAKIAGCGEIVVCTPPNQEGGIAPEILYVAQRLGITSVYACGGAQAIAAMAFGTETLPAVYKILGPGNQYVTEAKQQVQAFGVAIDMPAGPSEVLVIAEEGSNPAFIASDLLSQAEHGPDSQVILVTNDETLARAVQDELELQLSLLPRQEIARKALEHSFGVLLSSPQEMIAFSNTYAPEHLIVHAEDTTFYEANIVNAGSVFLGAYTPESAGDYASGTNHTLPTNGYAKNHSGVSVDTFVKNITFQRMSPQGIQHLGRAIIEMANAEHLKAHAQAVAIRLNHLHQ